MDEVELRLKRIDEMLDRQTNHIKRLTAEILCVERLCSRLLTEIAVACEAPLTKIEEIIARERSDNAREIMMLDEADLASPIRQMMLQKLTEMLDRVHTEAHLMLAARGRRSAPPPP